MGDHPGEPRQLRRGTEGRQHGVLGTGPGRSPLAFVLPFSAGFVILIGLAAWVLVYYIRLPATIRYILSAEAVLIQGGRLRLALPYHKIDQVTLASPRGMPWRKFGAQLPGLVWGSGRGRTVCRRT